MFNFSVIDRKWCYDTFDFGKKQGNLSQEMNQQPEFYPRHQFASCEFTGHIW